MTTPDDKEHDKLLCERLATTVDHGICKCAERHRVAKLEAELAAERGRREDIGEIGAMSKDGTRIGSLARVGLSMRLTAPARLQTWAHASRMQSDETTYDLERTVVGSVVAGATANCCGQCGACDRAVVPLAVGNREAGDVEMMGPGKDVRPTSAGMWLDDNVQDIVDLLRLTAGGNECSYAAQGASEIERLREVVTACHQALFQAQEAAKALLAKGEMLAAVVQGAKEEFVRVPYGASHEDVAAINDWHKMAAEALSEWENKA